MDKVAALLTTSVSREADIKIQKNNALNYNLATAMVDDFTNMETPDTSIQGGYADSTVMIDDDGSTGGMYDSPTRVY